MQRDTWDRGESICKLAEFVFRLLRQQLGGRYWGQLQKCFAPGGERLHPGWRVRRVAPRWDPHDVELEAVTKTERGDLLEEVVYPAAAAATFAESAERNAAVRQRKYSAIALSFRGEMPQER